jgi:hypothetical protein
VEDWSQPITFLFTDRCLGNIQGNLVPRIVASTAPEVGWDQKVRAAVCGFNLLTKKGGVLVDLFRTLLGKLFLK